MATTLNKAQMEAVLNPIDSCTKIVAGAGCGKTKVISSRFSKLAKDLKNEQNPLERILVITFTDKAANEMKERICQTLGEDGIDYYGQDLWVSTFHSFCSKILRKHSIEVDLAPNFKLSDAKKLKEIYDSIIEKIKNAQMEDGILKIENIKKISQIENIETIFESIFETIKKIKSLGLTPEEFLTETVEATKNFSNIVENLPFNCDDYPIFWSQYLKKYTDNFCNFNDAFDKIASKKLIISKNNSKKIENWGYAKDYPENIEKIEKSELYLIQVIYKIYEIYENELLKLSIIDFDDLINKTIKILKNNPEIREYYQNQFKHIIIDEFQDTNGAQLELIKLLLNNNSANITFVGDRKQSIYGFRHARMENLEVLHSFIESKYNKKYPEIMLSTNYRSTDEVINTINFLTGEFLNLDEKLSANKKAKNKQVSRTVFTNITDAYDLKVKQAKFITDEIIKLNVVNFSDIAILVNSHSEAEFIEKYLLKQKIPAIKKVNTGFFKSPVVKNLIALLRLAYNKFDEQALIRVLKISHSEAWLYKIYKALDNTDKKLNFAQKFFATDFGIEFEKLINIKNQNVSNTFYKLINNIAPINAKNDYENYRAKLDVRTFEKIIEDYENSHNFIYLGDFIKYLDEISEDVDFELPNVIVKNTDAVNILTIHASKGLEFEYVFCTSTNTRTQSSNNGIVFDLGYGEMGNFGLIANNFKGKETPKALLYKNIWEKPRIENEKMRLFYVAISRAKKYLNIIDFEPYNKVKSPKYREVATPTLL